MSRDELVRELMTARERELFPVEGDYLVLCDDPNRREPPRFGSSAIEAIFRALLIEDLFRQSLDEEVVW